MSDSDTQLVMDEIGIEAAKKRFEQYKKEKETFTNGLKGVDYQLETLPKKYDNMLKIQEIVLENDNLAKVTPTHKYEADPRFIELKKLDIRMQLEEEQLKFEAQMESLNKQRAAIQGQLDNSATEMEKEKARLKEVGVDVE